MRFQKKIVKINSLGGVCLRFKQHYIFRLTFSVKGTIPKDLVAFSDPTNSGRMFAMSCQTERLFGLQMISIRDASSGFSQRARGSRQGVAVSRLIMIIIIIVTKNLKCICNIVVLLFMSFFLPQFFLQYVE